MRTVLRRLEEKGLRHASRRQPHVRVLRRGSRVTQAAARAIKRIIDWFCDGAADEVLVGMVDADMLDRKQLRSIHCARGTSEGRAEEGRAAEERSEVMTSLLIESVLRATALAAAVWLVLRALRIRSPWLERSAWLLVLASSWTMPLLMNLLGSGHCGSGSKLAVASRADHCVPARAARQLTLRAPLWGALTIAIILVLRHSLGVVRWHRVRRAARRISSSSFAGLDIRVTNGVNAPATVFASILVPDDFILGDEGQRTVIGHGERARRQQGFLRAVARTAASLRVLVQSAGVVAAEQARPSERAHQRRCCASGNAEDVRRTRRCCWDSLRGAPSAANTFVSMARGRSLGARIDRLLTNTKPATTPGRRIWI